ncbi:Coiled-coil and C2 domain-containing protein 1B [Phytophthora citrophthora]|uniref:Coiled-coil and C2 domain-containing protein 1B n=1 Tax=Phytophthora citrophthora TaxID=4793 RepID=A0AAD9LRZ9_9STRA|nr:Coiled-coil and C2 domain-containing protein 1B [Phytophthora citrophthora]
MLNRAKEAAVEETDDLTKLQKQFGITPVGDADVQAEFQALLAATGAATGSSPTEESILFGSGGDDEEDEEAKILRDLQINGLSLSDEESVGHQEAKDELRGVLDEVHQTARENHSREAAEMNGKTIQKEEERGAVLTPERAAQVHALKMEALTLKRAGDMQGALAKFREANQLQEQFSSAQGSVARASDREAVTKQPEEPAKRVRPPVDTMLDDDEDVEVTEEDMKDPEFLAQLAKMGLTDDHGETNREKETVGIHTVMQQISVLDRQIHECKMKAVQLKRHNQITEALACMRQIKELEAKRDELRSSPVPSSREPAIQQPAAPTIEESTYHTPEVRTITRVHLNASVAGNLVDSDNEDTLDVEVTDEDMDDPAFAAELQTLGGGGTPSTNLTATSASTVVIAASASAAPSNRILPSSRSLKNAVSIDEDYLIDAFDDKSDSEGEGNHLTTVMSSGSLHSVSSVPDMKMAVPPAEEVCANLQVGNKQITDLTAQLHKSRETALSLKRKGDIQGALESMRRAKQIQNLIDLKQQASGMTTSIGGLEQNSARTAQFHELEQLLVEFGNQAMTQAKESLSVNREKASEWLAKRKKYGIELEKLRQMRQNPSQLPPRYEIVRSSRQVEFELPFIADDRIKVSVKSVNGLSQAAGKSVFVKFCLNFPSATPHEGQTPEFQINSNASFVTKLPSKQAEFGFKLARSRGTMRLFEIKKAIFEVWKPGTLFRNPELVARAYQELTPLLTCCEINTHLPFLGSNRKPCGGDIEVAIQMRRPLKEREHRQETVEELVIGDYPEPATASSDHPPMPTVALNPPPVSKQSPSKAATPRSDSSISPTHQENPASTTAAVNDPHHVDLIISYDVITEELEKVGAKLPSLTGPASIELSDRYDSLALKKQLLEIEMQTGKLTLDMYVERLHERIAEDRVLISHLLASNRRLDAARVLHRIKIMEKELEGTEDGSAES